MAEESIIPKAWRSWRQIKPSDPKKINKLVETGIRLRALRKDLEAKAASIKKEQDAVEEFLIQNFTSADLRVVKTRAGTASLSEKDVPRATDWEAIEKHILATKEFDLLQRRLGEKACQERWNNGKEIPGVTKYHDKRIKFGED